MSAAGCPPPLAPRRHPRLAARRVAVARASGRRRLRRAVAVLALLALAGGGWTLVHSPLLAARHVRILGAAHTPVAEVLAVTGLGSSPPLVDVDPGAEAAALRQLAWVRAASVTRNWPDGVTVSIVERRPTAALPLVAGRFVLADASGRVLAAGVARPKGLVEVLAPARRARPGGQLPASDDALLAVAAGLPPSLRGEVQAVEPEEGGGVLLRLTAGPLVELGSAGDLAEQAVALATLLAKVPMEGILTIDLRVPDAPVLTP